CGARVRPRLAPAPGPGVTTHCFTSACVTKSAGKQYGVRQTNRKLFAGLAQAMRGRARFARTGRRRRLSSAHGLTSDSQRQTQHLGDAPGVKWRGAGATVRRERELVTDSALCLALEVLHELAQP